jgi:Zn-dependent protease with chaperone function
LSTNSTSHAWPAARRETAADHGTWAVLLAVTLLLELPFAWLRYKIIRFFGYPVTLAFAHSRGAALFVLFVLSFFGIIRAVISLAAPIGAGWWWRNQEGGREPSGPERVSYTDAITELASSGEIVHPPRQWFVVDDAQPGAAVCGDTLMVTRGLLTNQYLTAVLAHELGHLNSIDGRLTCALNRVIFKEPRRNPELEAQDPPGGITMFWRFMMWFLRGGIGVKLLGPSWASWWRRREYVADQYAKTLGYGEEFADYLEEYGLFYDRPVPFVWLTLQTHPPVELRIDRLRDPLAGVTREELDELEAALPHQRDANPEPETEPEAEPEGAPETASEWHGNPS